jgi:hypothetical protein
VVTGEASRTTGEGEEGGRERHPARLGKNRCALWQQRSHSWEALTVPKVFPYSSVPQERTALAVEIEEKVEKLLFQ